MRFSRRELGELLVNALALGPVALGIVVADEGALDVAVLRAGDDVFDATVAPVEAGHWGEGADAFFAEIFVEEILAVDVGEVGVLGEAAERFFGGGAALLAIAVFIRGAAAELVVGGEDE